MKPKGHAARSRDNRIAGYAAGGVVSPKMVESMVHKHERVMHPGKPLTKLGTSAKDGAEK